MAAVDVKMPLRWGAAIAGDVIAGLVGQSGSFRLFVDAGEDFVEPPVAEGEPDGRGRSAVEREILVKRKRIAFRRNRLRSMGDSALVYLADADIVLPHGRCLADMTAFLKRCPDAGAAGLRYQHDRHVACGSMMLRRSDFERVGPLEHGQGCLCGFIGGRLATRGLSVKAASDARALSLDPGAPDLTGDRPTLHCRPDGSGSIPHAALVRLVKCHGTRFRLVVEH